MSLAGDETDQHVTWFHAIPYECCQLGDRFLAGLSVSCGGLGERLGRRKSARFS